MPYMNLSSPTNTQKHTHEEVEGGKKNINLYSEINRLQSKQLSLKLELGRIVKVVERRKNQILKERRKRKHQIKT